jgi:glycosyltransferase involved in cell wall biosynthesis
VTRIIERPGVVVAAGGWHDECAGGANRLPTDFARYLAARGYAVSYICPSAAVTGLTRTETDGVRLSRYPVSPAPSPSPRNAWHHFRSARDAAREAFRDLRPSVLLGHSQLQYLGAAWICPRGTRRCFAVHSPFVRELRENAAGPTWRHRLAWQAAAGIERHILSASDVVHCDSAYTRDVLRDDYTEARDTRVIVLPGWVDLSKFRVQGNRDELRRRLGPPWTPGVPTFFTLRRLVPRMGIDRLIDAAAALARAGREFRVVVAGEGPERSRLEERAGSQGLGGCVSFAGRLNEARIADHFAAADCFVLPTRTLECFGLIILEAYACGVPVIGVPVGSIPEVMGPDLAGWIADGNDAAALARRMDDALSGRLSAEPERLRARAQEFEISVVAREHERVLLGGAAVREPAERLAPAGRAAAPDLRIGATLEETLAGLSKAAANARR